MINADLKKLEYLSCFVGASSNRIPKGIRLIGTLTWLLSLTFHFSYDIYEATRVYGLTFLTAQAIWFLSLLATTWGTVYMALPWLADGNRELERDECYGKTIQKTLKLFQIFPYIIITFGLVASGIQHTMLHLDKALHMDFRLNSTESTKIILQTIRFVSGVHVYAGCALFWIVPTSIMLMTGYSMAEFVDQMSIKMKDKERILTFKEAISSYSKRAKFVKTSSSKTFVVLTNLLFTGILCFGLNAYVFLFGKRNYLHVWHSLLPLILMIYPLCTAAWVTKQYTWFIIAVVRAWVHRDDLDESSDDSGIDEENNRKASLPAKIKRRFFGSFSRKKSSEIHSHIPNYSTSDAPRKYSDLLPWQKVSNPETNNVTSPEKVFATAVTAVTSVSKLRGSTRRPRFNFEKFLSYLESMRSVVGFHIAGVMVTWDLVSTTLFLLFSVVAVFMQESIFGSQKSTLSNSS